MNPLREEEWRRLTQSECSWCSQPLLFLEGPICDHCLNQNERQKAVAGESILFAEEPVSAVIARDRFAVNLETGEFVLPEKARAITVPEFRPSRVSKRNRPRRVRKHG